MVNPVMTEQYFHERGIHYLPQDEYDKAVGQLRLQLNGVFNVFMVYGQDVYVPQAVREVVKLCEDFGLRVRGVDKPLLLDRIRNGR